LSDQVTFINTTKHFPEITMVELLKYFKPKQHGEDNDDGENPMGLTDPNVESCTVFFHRSYILMLLYTRHWRKNTGHVAHTVHFTNSSAEVCYWSKSY